MSNVIPIVSSSPPPLDDDGDFKWDDDDDEYGNFTCAPTVSAMTINSDSSIDINWSNSKSPGPPHHGSSLGKDTKTHASKENLHISECDRGTSENTSTDKLSSIQGTEDCLPVDDNVIQDEDDFQDFAQFDNVDFSEGPVQALGEATEKEPHSVKDCMPPTAHTESPAAHGGGVSSTADLTEEDEFQDFAQFSGDATAESSESSTSNQPVFTEHSSEVSKHDANSTSSPDSTCEDVHSLGLDLGSDPGAPRAESAGSVPLKSTDSTYSNASTVDSGVFSTDLSPSCQPGEPSDIYLNTDKEERQVHTHPVLHSNDIFPPPDSVSSARSPDIAPSLEASHEHCKATAALGNIVSKDALEINVVSDHSDNDCDGDVSPDSDNVSNHNAQTDFASCNTADDLANVKDEHLVKNLSFPVKEQLDVTSASSGEELEYSLQQNEASNYSTVSTSDAGELSSDDPSGVNASSNVSPLAAASDDGVLDGETLDSDIVDSGVSSEEVKDELGDKAQMLNSSSVNSDVNIECNTEGSVQSNTGNDSQSEYRSLVINHEKSGSLNCDLKCDVAADSELLNKDTSTCSLSSATDVVGKSFDKSDVLESKEAFDDFEDADEGEDKEFGDFSTYGCQKDEDSSEVAPIMFRTSICETEEVVDDDDFTFDRKRPPVFDDDDDDGEFGAAGTDISDERNNDDFGEFDAAQKVQPNLLVADAGMNAKENDDDEFGDFDKSEPVDDGASWADFGSAATPSVASDNFGSSTSKLVVPQAFVNQSQVQKLHNAVINCFVVASEGDSSVLQTDPLTGESQESQPRDNSHGGSSVREDESPLPLDMVVDLGLSKALEAKQQTWTLVQHPSKKDPKVRLWAHLKDMDTSHALMYGWHSSHCSKEVYTSLHIDTQNILFSHKKQAVPFFASGLGILEPIRGGGGGGVVERKKEKSTAPTTQTILLESGRQEYRQSPTVQDIPPVDFDWSSSGLTNPLTANTLDLDFLVIQGGDSSEKTSVFKAEDRDSAPPAMQPLEDILKRTTPTVKLATNEILSPEAVRVLERMPDLSFMQSRVLMFPVKQ